MLARAASASALFALQPRRARAPASRAAMASALPLCHVFLPAPTRAAGRPPPLVVLLHGTGADEHDLLEAGEELQQALGGELAVASVRAPLSLGYGGFAWFEGYSFAPERRALEHTVRDSASRVIAFLEAAPAALGTDPECQALFCFSQGATIGWTVCTSVWPRPNLLAGACLLSGRLFPEHAQATPLAAGNAPAEVLRLRSIYATHGEADGTTPVALARESMQTAAALYGDDAAFAARVQFQPHTGGHEIPRSVMRNAAAAMKRWFA